MGIYDVMNEENMETISRIEEASDMVEREANSESPNKSLVTKLLMEQLLRGIYLR